MKRQYFVPFKIGSLCREAECPPTLTTLTTPPTTQCPGNNDNRNVTEESIQISLDFTCYFVWLRQDSELQSVSSHNDTTDDNQSSFTESSSHYSNTYRWLLLKSLLRETLLVFLVTTDTFDIALLCPDIEYQLMKTPKHVKCWALVLQFQQLCKPAVRIKGADFDLLCMQ